MNKKSIFLMLLLMFFANLRVDAVSSCSYKEQAELNSEAAQIKVKYEEKSELYYPPAEYCGEAGEGCSVNNYYFTITILNMSENFYIEVDGNKNKQLTFTYDDVKDGIITFNYENVDEIGNFTFNVYSSSETNCAYEKYRVIHFTTPKFNRYYYDGECSNVPDYYLCQKYITTEEPKYGDFLNQITEYKRQLNEEKEKNNRNFLEKIFDFVDNHKTLLGITTTIVVAGVVTVVIVKKRKESIWKEY